MLALSTDGLQSEHTLRYNVSAQLSQQARLAVELVDDAFEASHHLAPLQPLLTSDQQQIQQQEEEQGGGIHELDTRTVGREMCQVTAMIHCIG